MKFTWKIFLSTVMVIAVVFAVGGYVLITSAFENSLKNAAERACEENQLTKLAYEGGALAYVNQGIKLTDEAVSNIAAQLGKSGGRGILIADAEFKPVFTYGGTVNEDLMKRAGSGRVYEVTGADGAYLITVCSQTTTGGRSLYLQTSRDVTSLFHQREQQFGTYTQWGIMLLVLSALVMLFVSVLLTRPLRRLSAAAKRIAAGSYDERLKSVGNDEIGGLARDFNAMSEAVEERVYQLESAARQREDFVASFAHELKTPLTSIIGYADMLRSRQMEPEDAFISANYIFTEGKRLEALSLKLLELMVLERQEFEKKRVNPRILIEEIDGLMRPIMERNEMTLNARGQDGIVLIEPDLFKTLLVNLIDNSRKASGPGSVIELVGRPDGRDYVFYVQDHGRGIPQEEIRRITEAFYMVDKSRARAQNGAGLGLALSDKIARLHGSRLEFKSRVGQGTLVCVRLKRERGRA